VPAPVRLPYPPLRLPQGFRSREPQAVAVTRHARRKRTGLLARLPRRSARQLIESAAAIALIVIFAPVLAATAIAIKITSRGPVLFRQDRTGLHRDVFTMFKFRTMYVDNDDTEQRRLMRDQLIADEPPTGGQPGIYKIAQDPRVTPLGRLLRQFSVDELPQLWNVVRGEMSLVGPRPYVPWEAEFFPREVEARFSVRPGMTGLWQVSGRSTLDYRTALNIDVYYAENKSLWLDLNILARTVVVVFDRSGTR
jgi:lipopolysaccharide/colanic/teichoic acid biosynthesis glycosyltransferase